VDGAVVEGLVVGDAAGLGKVRGDDVMPQLVRTIGSTLPSSHEWAQVPTVSVTVAVGFARRIASYSSPLSLA
jgi:hypothetical protein